MSEQSIGIETREKGRSGAGAGVGIVLVALGLLFLAGQFIDIDLGHILWPFFIVVPGLAFFAAMVMGGRSAGGLAIPGSVLTMIGLILLYQNTFDHFESWSYSWALIIVAVGTGLFVNGVWSEKPRLVEQGKHLASIGAVLFLVFGAFFELAIGISGRATLGSVIWPLFLIAAGAWLFFRGFVRRSV